MEKLENLDSSVKSLTIVLEEIVNQMSRLREEMYLLRIAKEKEFCVEHEVGTPKNPFPPMKFSYGDIRSEREPAPQGE